MKVTHLTKEDYNTGKWSGGTTTELLIWPEGSSYAERRFQVRISSATVDLDESDFTPLPGVIRYITPLTGGFTLTHPGKAPVVMGILDAPYRFDGGEDTHCDGRATDFNLMLKGAEGSMEICEEEGEIIPGLNCFYAVKKAVFTLKGVKYEMNSGDMLVAVSDEEAVISLGKGRAICCHASV